MPTFSIAPGVELEVPNGFSVQTEPSDVTLPELDDGRSTDPFIAALADAVGGYTGAGKRTDVFFPLGEYGPDGGSDQPFELRLGSKRNRGVTYAVLEERDDAVRWVWQTNESGSIALKRTGTRWRGWLVRLIGKWAVDKLNDWVKTLLPRQGLLQIMSPGDPDDEDSLKKVWVPRDSTSALRHTRHAGPPKPMPADGPTHILLWIHGTFVNTYASYGALCGNTLVRRMLRSYDAVIAFDHDTFVDDPMENARKLLRAMQHNWKNTPTVDIITTSRGSLVARSLVERLLPAMHPAPFEVGKVLMVAPSAGGTALAAEDRWALLLNQLTACIKDLASALVALFPNAALVVRVVEWILRGTIGLLQLVVWGVSNTSLLSGVGALQPEGDFIQKTMNGDDLEHTLQASFEGYWWFRSNFEFDGPNIQDPPTPAAWLQAADSAVDAFLHPRQSDLVIDQASSLHGHDDLKDCWKEGCDFGTNGDVHHLNFWLFVATRRRMAEILQLKDI